MEKLKLIANTKSTRFKKINYLINNIFKILDGLLFMRSYFQSL